MRILVIRHGESEADLLNVCEGRADFGLTEKGQLQAESMSRWIKAHYTVDRIYCSPLKRAYQTASTLSALFNLPLNVDEQLLEFNNGLIAGLLKDIAKEKYPFVANLPVHMSVYGQESKLEFRFRADCFLSKILSENKTDSTVAVVSHGGMISQLFNSFMNISLSSSVQYCTGDAGVHEWVIDGKEKRIVFSNHCCHT